MLTYLTGYNYFIDLEITTIIPFFFFKIYLFKLKRLVSSQWNFQISLEFCFFFPFFYVILEWSGNQNCTKKFLYYIFITFTFLFIRKYLQSTTKSHWNTIFRERYIITPWNNSWVITDSLKTIILRVVWLLSQWTAYTVHRMSLFSYQILCTYCTLPLHHSEESVITQHLHFPGTYFQITEELWWTSLTRLLKQLISPLLPYP